MEHCIFDPSVCFTAMAQSFYHSEYFWLFWCFVAVAGSTAAAAAVQFYFPGTLATVLRKLAGFITFAVVVGLSGYFRGKYDQKNKDQKIIDGLKKKQRSPEQQYPPFKWPWQ